MSVWHFGNGVFWSLSVCSTPSEIPDFKTRHCLKDGTLNDESSFIMMQWLTVSSHSQRQTASSSSIFYARVALLCFSPFLPLPTEEEELENEGFCFVFFLLLVSLLSVLIFSASLRPSVFLSLLLLPLFPFLSWILQFGFPCFAMSRPNFTLQEMREYTGQELLREWVTGVPRGWICLLYKSPCCPQSAKLLINRTARCHISSPLNAE